MHADIFSHVIIFVMCFSPVAECKGRWKTLTDGYRKHLATVQEVTKSGSGQVLGKQWQFATVMSFMKPHIAKRDTSGNLGTSATTSQGNLHFNCHVLYIHLNFDQLWSIIAPL